jgi:hypothetical protein
VAFATLLQLRNVGPDIGEVPINFKPSPGADCW